MRIMRDGYDGLSLVMLLNLDRAFFFGTLPIALLLGRWLGGL